jgi:hypothetical protein
MNLTVSGMPTHKLLMTIPQGVVLNKDVIIDVHSNESKLGELHLSKGTIDWWPTRAKTAVASMTWEKFDQIMQGHRDQTLRIDQ